ncbi:LPS-assembly lipoprotein LptE [Aquicella lusitana]|uniref:LPS-assembly lipoprotein LptE n=1 Tax=Aquicella lusitana TaxID=254246 RepID=A0A370GHJ1_9COXI|nr:LPS assembly lipoprotein LptE [Aquicella lusitana]RDI42830.1 LPS-assembly lipoprotein [Aquicella lusitana]VVC73073.1 LPS-assembly lipoprotein LptE [Aquicella lusitana]
MYFNFSSYRALKQLNGNSIVRLFLLLASTFILTSCGFHLQGEMQLAPPLHRMYIQSADPYSYLVRNLRQYLKLSKVELVSTPAEADTILVIVSDTATQQLLSVSGTQQTRQYKLIVTVVIEIQDAKGRIIVAPSAFTEERTITTQSNQILGSSNDVNLLYQQMRRVLAYAIMNRLASKQVTHAVNKAFASQPNQRNMKLPS